jgi:hypothetical protein
MLLSPGVVSLSLLMQSILMQSICQLGFVRISCLMLIDAANLLQIGLAGSSAIKACRRSGHRVHAFRADCEDRPEYQYPALIARPRFHFRDDSAI